MKPLNQGESSSWTPLYGLCILGTALLAYRALFPAQMDVERYWMASLGSIVLQTSRIPRTLTPPALSDPNLSWVPHEWLFSTVLELSRSHHVYYLFAFVVALVTGFSFWLYAFECRDRDIDPLIAGVGIGVAIVVGFGFFEVRAASLTWTLLPLLLRTARTQRYQIFLVPLLFVWANLHASVIIALAYVFAYAIDHSIRGTATWRASAIFALAVVAAFATPFGGHLYVYAVTTIDASWHQYIDEWKPLWTQPAYASLLFTVLLLPVFLRGRYRSGKIVEIAIVAGLGFAAILAVRNIELFWLVATPIVWSMKQIELAKPVRYVAVVGWGAAYVMICCLLLSSRSLIRDPVFGIWTDASSPAALAALDFKGHHVFCETLMLCNVVLYRGGRTYGDGRCDPFPLAVFAETVAIDRGLRDLSVLRGRDVDTVVARAGSPLALSLRAASTWREQTGFANGMFVIATTSDMHIAERNIDTRDGTANR